MKGQGGSLRPSWSFKKFGFFRSSWQAPKRNKKGADSSQIWKILFAAGAGNWSLLESVEETTRVPRSDQKTPGSSRGKPPASRQSQPREFPGVPRGRGAPGAAPYPERDSGRAPGLPLLEVNLPGMGLAPDLHLHDQLHTSREAWEASWGLVVTGRVIPKLFWGLHIPGADAPRAWGSLREVGPQAERHLLLGDGEFLVVGPSGSSVQGRAERNHHRATKSTIPKALGRG